MGIFRVMGVVAGTLSLVMLLKLGLVTGGYVGPLLIAVDYYEAWTHALTGWLEPYIQLALSGLQASFDLHLSLHPHWKHILLLMWLYFGADARTYWARRKYGFSITTILWGGVVAFAASICSGVAPITAGSANRAIAAIPIGGVVIYELGIIVWKMLFFEKGATEIGEAFRSGLVRFLIPTLFIGLGTLAVGDFAKNAYGNQRPENQGLLILATFVVGLVVFRFLRGIWTATYDRDMNETWMHRFRRSGSTRIAGLMVSTLLGAAAYIALNAGLRLYGL